MIDLTGDKIRDNLLVAEKVELQIKKGTKDLEEVLTQVLLLLFSIENLINYA